MAVTMAIQAMGTVLTVYRSKVFSTRIEAVGRLHYGMQCNAIQYNTAQYSAKHRITHEERRAIFWTALRDDRGMGFQQ